MSRSRPLRIGIDASRMAVARPTGTERYAGALIRALVALDRPHDYVLYCRGKPVDGFGGGNVRQQLIRPGRLWTHLGLSLEMLRRPPDVLFVPAHVLPLWRPRRTVVTVHDLGYLYYPSAHRRANRWYLDLSNRNHVRVATRMIADSEATKRDLMKFYRADPARISVVPLAPDERFRPVTEPARLAGMRARYADGRDYLLFVGTLQPRKNVIGLIEAHARLRRHRPDAPSLVVAGQRGWLADPIFARASALALGDTVRFVNYVPDDELPALFSAAIAFAFPSFYEGFGLPALEAMACGTPVVAANSASLPEVVGDAGLLVDPADVGALAEALEAVSFDAALRGRLRDKGLARAGTFSWRRCAEETLRVIETAAV